MGPLLPAGPGRDKGGPGEGVQLYNYYVVQFKDPDHNLNCSFLFPWSADSPQGLALVMTTWQSHDSHIYYVTSGVGIGLYYAQKFGIVRKSILSSVLLLVWRGMCGCVLGERNVKWMDATTRETVLYGLSISEPHLHTFHALFCALKIGLIVQVYPEVRIFL